LERLEVFIADFTLVIRCTSTSRYAEGTRLLGEGTLRPRLELHRELQESQMNETFAGRTWKLNSIRTGPRGETPVVLIHPVGLDLTYWGAQIEALRVHYDVVAFDLPGQGSSPGVPDDWTIPQAVSFVDQIAQSTGSPRVHLVGLSVGTPKSRPR
jgi:pimeloyl-ACP methyl ester carboxylesterase